MSTVRALASSMKATAGRWYHPQRTCDFESFDLLIDRRDQGGVMYESLDYWADLVSPIERDIVARCEEGQCLAARMLS